MTGREYGGAAWRSLGLGVAILALGGFWLTAIVRAELRSSGIQHGIATIAAVENRRFIQPCLRNTCRQTEFTVRYLARGTVQRAVVLADDWDESHPVGSQIPVVYAPSDPGRAEIRGHPPSRIVPTIGASLALGAGIMLTWMWARVILRERRQNASDPSPR
jgi:uncharacterized protein DUF3592